MAEISLKAQTKALVEATLAAVDYLDRPNRRKLRIQESFFLFIHKYMLSYDEKIKGRYRKTTDEIKIKATFTPTPAWQIQLKIKDLIDFINNRRRWGPTFYHHVLTRLNKDLYSKTDLERYYKIFIAWYIHHGLVTIHPFCDGNGRMARLLMCLVLRDLGLSKSSYPPMINEVIRKDKNKYLDSLSQADSNNYISGLDYMTQALTKAYLETEERSKRLRGK